MNRKIIPWLLVWLFPLFVLGQNQNCGLENPLELPNDAPVTYRIEIDGYANDDLSDPGQGVCGVEVKFNNSTPTSLVLTLRSPQGEEVTLFGPNNTNDLDLGTLGDVRFVPCVPEATAIPDLGFPEQWDNNALMNTALPRFTGSYYPFDGCLQNFTSGPVNGTWELIVNNSNINDISGSNIIDFEIIFCNEDGIFCCRANPGTIVDPNLDPVCINSPDANLANRIAPIYQDRAPDPLEYGYTYIITENDQLIDYAGGPTRLDGPDLSSYPAGDYTIYGLSYRIAEGLPLITNYNTIDDLRAEFASNTTYCGAITTSAFSFSIIEPIADAGQIQTVTCARPTVEIGGDNTSEGNFTYQWTKLPVPGSGEIVAGADEKKATVDGEGTFQLTVTSNITGCTATTDVIVEERISPPLTSIEDPEILTCGNPRVVLDASLSDSGPDYRITWEEPIPGSSITEGRGTLMPTVQHAGEYRLNLFNIQTGCENDFSVTVVDSFPQINLNIATVDTVLNCANPSILLDATGSSTGPGLSYIWRVEGGATFSDGSPSKMGLTVPTDVPARYRLQVIDNFSRCNRSDTLLITEDFTQPLAQAGPDQTIDCGETTTVLNGNNSSPAGEIAYQWSGPSGSNILDAETAMPTVDQDGRYYLSITHLRSQCTSIDSVDVAVNNAQPTIDDLIASPFDCVNGGTQTIRAEVTPSDPANSLTYSWVGPGIIGSADTPSITIDQPGTYTVTVDEAGLCPVSQDIVITNNFSVPFADPGSPQTITCTVNQVTLGGTATSAGPDITYEWFTNNGNIIGDNTNNTIGTDQSGVYGFIVTNTTNACRDTALITVSEDTASPLFDTIPNQIIPCNTASATLDASTIVSGANLQYSWTGPCIISDPSADNITVDCPGAYVLRVDNPANGCFASDTTLVSLDPNVPLATISQDQADIDCTVGNVTLDASASNGGTPTWFLDGVALPSNNLIQTVNQPGVYRLEVLNEVSGCLAVDSVIVNADCKPVINLLSMVDTLTCLTPAMDIEVAVSPTGPGYEYQWTSANNCFVGNTDNPSVRVNCGDTYQLIVTNPNLLLSDTLSITIPENKTSPVAQTEDSATIDCNNPIAVLNGTGSSTGPNMIYTWTDENGNILARDINSNTSTTGIYFLEVTDTENGCASVSQITVNENRATPAITFDSLFYPCFRDSFRVNAILSPASLSYQLEWSGQGIMGSDTSSSIITSGPGQYDLMVTDLRNGCTTTATLDLQDSNCPPCLTTLTPDTITCSVPEISIEAQFCDDCTGCNIAWTTTNGNIVSGGNSLTPIVSEPGTYTITATKPNGLANTASVMVTARRTPPTVNAGNNQLINCISPIATLAGTVSNAGNDFTIEWRRQSDQQFFGDSLSINTNREGIYTLTVTNLETGCAAGDDVNVSLDTLSPSVNVQPPGVITCNERSIILDATGSTFPNTGTFSWTGPDNVNISGVNSPNPIINSGGTYTLRITDTVNGCSAETVIDVIADTIPPAIQAIPNAQVNCRNTAVTLTGNLAFPSYNFEWCQLAPDGSAINCNTTDLAITATTPGSYRFRVTDPDNGCTAEDMVIVSENLTPPDIDAGIAGPLTCSNSQIQLNGSIPSNGNYTIRWSALNNSPIDAPDSLTPTVTEPDLYFLEVTDQSSGCSNMDSVEVILDALVPVLNVGNDTVINCLNPSIRLGAQISTPSANLEYNWSTLDGNIVVDSNTLTPLVDAAGTYLLTVRDNTNGCSSVDFITVREDIASPDVNIDEAALEPLSCSVDRVLINGAGSSSASGGALAYNWEALDLDVNIIGNTRQSFIEVSQPGIYLLTVTDETNGCESSTEVEITADFSTPEVQIAPVGAINCYEDPVFLDGSQSATGSNFTATWRNSANEIIATDYTTEVNSGGFYRLIIDNMNNGCVDSLSVFVPVDTVAPQVNLFSNDLLTCTTSQATISSTVNGNSQYTYEWSTAGGSIVSNAMDNNITVDQPGQYSLLVTDQINGCNTTAVTVVEESTEAVTGATIFAENPNCRDPKSGRIIIETVEGNRGPYLFALDGGPFISRNEFRGLSVGEYRLSIQNIDGCELDTLITLDPPAEFSVDLGPTQQIIPLGQDVALSPVIVGAYDTLRWTNDSTILDPTAVNQVVMPFENTLYEITIINSEGCIATDNVFIKVDKTKAVYIPNVFAPASSNEANNRFTIFAKDNGTVDTITKLSIYNRWGMLVFERENFPPNDLSFGWDGTFDGQLLNNGVFTYTANISFINGERKVYHGDVVLLR